MTVAVSAGVGDSQLDPNPITPMDPDNSPDTPPIPRIKKRRLAADGRPQEMFADVHRAAHRWLMANAGQECDEYRAEQTIVRVWMSKHKINPGYRDDQPQ